MFKIVNSSFNGKYGNECFNLKHEYFSMPDNYLTTVGMILNFCKYLAMVKNCIIEK